MGARQLSKIKGEAGLLKMTKAPKHTYTLHFPLHRHPFHLSSVTHIPARQAILIAPSSKSSKTQNHKWAELWRKQTWLYPDSAAIPINIGCTFRQRQHAGDQVVQHRLSAPAQQQCSLTAVIYNSLAYFGVASASCSISPPPATLSLGCLIPP